MADFRVQTTSMVQDDRSWLIGTHGTDMTPSILLDVSAFTAGTHYPNGVIPSGTILAETVAGGSYAPYDPANTTTSLGVAVGVLFSAVAVDVLDNTHDATGAMLIHGYVSEARLPFSADEGSIDAAGKVDLPLIVFGA